MTRFRDFSLVSNMSLKSSCGLIYDAILQDIMINMSVKLLFQCKNDITKYAAFYFQIFQTCEIHQIARRKIASCTLKYNL